MGGVMRSRVFLTPMTPDGTPGEAKEILYHESSQKYLEPVPYFSGNGPVDAARAKVSAAETALRHAQSRGLSPTELLRYQSTLTSARAELDAAEYPRRKQRHRETGIGRDDVPPAAMQSLAEATSGLVK